MKERKQMEPIFFEPTYKDVVWGGENISKIFKRNIEGNTIGESWEISAHPNGLSIIKNGEFKEKTLKDVFQDKSRRTEVFGSHCEELERFPILAKFLDTNNNLSIQVHPDNDYAAKHENDSGKNEVWYIMDCKENAKIVYGFKDNVTQETLENAMSNIEDNVNYLEVHKGDFIPIPPGTVHASMGGIVMCEIQQSSDLTYRIYDWNRIGKDGKPRELHKEKAINVVNLNNKPEIHNYSNIEGSTNLYRSDVFNIDIVKIDKEVKKMSNKESFYAYIVLEGEGNIKSKDFQKEIKKGDNFLIPSNLGEYSISGTLELMKVWI